jgi:hypothetical protein
MKIEDVENRVAEIERTKGDDERAHGMEDSLYRDVLLAISSGSTGARKLATAALKSEDIDFGRWTA